MVFSDDVLIGWNVIFRDTDGHSVFENGVKKVNSKPILIGEHVWICACSHIMKGVQIGTGSVVAMDSVATKEFIEPKLLIGGFPAKKLKENYSWKS